jgi:hypothetical protein
MFFGPVDSGESMPLLDNDALKKLISTWPERLGQRLKCSHFLQTLHD